MVPEAGQIASVGETCELFEGVSSFVTEGMISATRPKDYMYGDVMFFEGDPVNEVLLLTKGRAKLTRVGEEGREVILRLCVPGEIVSALALVPGGTHRSTAVALQTCKVLAWNAATFEAALERFPALRRRVQSILERRLAELEKSICEVSTLVAAPRLARKLIRLLDQIGSKGNGYVLLNVTRELLAQMTAMTLCTVSRLLAEWERQGVMSLGREVIEVRDVCKLSELSKGKWPVLN
jgi:CRP-like cAMP-binding protein